MKTLKLFSFVLIILALAILPVAAQSDSFTVTADIVNLRTGHGIEYPIIAQIFEGSIYPILAYSPTANWVQLDLGGGLSGWAFRHLGEVLRVNPNPVLGTGGAIVNTVSTVTVTNNNASLGQGGGFLPPTTTTIIDFTNAITIEEFNSTVGVLASLRMRSGPGLEHGIVWIIPYGERVTPIARNRGGSWILVNYEGREGWVFLEYLAAPPDLDLTALPVR